MKNRKEKPPKPHQGDEGDEVKKVCLADKPECPLLYRKTIQAINKYCSHDKKVIPFAEIHKTLSWMLHLNKFDRRGVLAELQEMDLIEIVPYHGIKLRQDSRCFARDYEGGKCKHCGRCWPRTKWQKLFARKDFKFSTISKFSVLPESCSDQDDLDRKRGVHL
ncbi:MAG: hypothetical protein ABOK23_12115 [Candidatus Methanoperedens sp.]|nr:hypothetical protein [Candidatus Methanoperedens sp.]MCZ7395291.1 hypothetical protein [Candidatus Methanoperedens sp.]